MKTLKVENMQLYILKQITFQQKSKEDNTSLGI